MSEKEAFGTFRDPLTRSDHPSYMKTFTNRLYQQPLWGGESPSPLWFWIKDKHKYDAPLREHTPALRHN